MASFKDNSFGQLIANAVQGIITTSRQYAENPKPSTNPAENTTFTFNNETVTVSKQQYEEMNQQNEATRQELDQQIQAFISDFVDSFDDEETNEEATSEENAK